VESWSVLLKESSLIPLVSLAKEHLWSLKVTRLQECIKNSSVESSSPLVWVAGAKYVVD